jgi:hypothetical protein
MTTSRTKLLSARSILLDSTFKPSEVNFEMSTYCPGNNRQNRCTSIKIKALSKKNRVWGHKFVPMERQTLFDKKNLTISVGEIFLCLPVNNKMSKTQRSRAIPDLSCLIFSNLYSVKIDATLKK